MIQQEAEAIGTHSLTHSLTYLLTYSLTHLLTYLLTHSLAIVFEQSTCAKLEEFWIDWRRKIHNLGQELRDSKRDYEIALATGKTKGKGTAKEMEIDNLVDTATEALSSEHKGSPQSSPVKENIEEKSTGQEEKTVKESVSSLYRSPVYNDLTAIKLLLGTHCHSPTYSLT
jgi:hypothetical protein